MHVKILALCHNFANYNVSPSWYWLPWRAYGGKQFYVVFCFRWNCICQCTVGANRGPNLCTLGVYKIKAQIRQQNQVHL